MEEAFFDTPIYREFAGLDAHGRMPDESTILRFRHRLEKHKLADQILATVNDLLAAQGLVAQGRYCGGCHLDCSAQLHQEQGQETRPGDAFEQKGNEWHFGMKAHIGVDADSGLHTPSLAPRATWPTCRGQQLRCTGRRQTGLVMQATKVSTSARMPRRQWVAHRDAPRQTQSAGQREQPVDALIDQSGEDQKHPCQGRASLQGDQNDSLIHQGALPGLKKNTLQLKTLFALSNLWMVRHQLLEAQG